MTRFRNGLYLVVVLAIVAGILIFQRHSTLKSEDPTVTPSMCSVYNDYVESQCIPADQLESESDIQLRQEYTQEKCRDQGFAMILETDDEAKTNCTPVKTGELVGELKPNS